MPPLHSPAGGGRFERDVDPVTGLRAAAAFRHDLAHAILGARVSRTPMTLALLRAEIGFGEGADRRARRVASALRRTDGFGYRLGQADFALIVPSALPADVAHGVARLAASLNHPLTGEPDPAITAGVAATLGAHAPDDLVAAAAGALGSQDVAA